MNQQQEISAEEIDARIMVLINQRNKAMDDAVILGSKVVMLEKKVKELETIIESTKKEVLVPAEKIS